MNILKMSTIMQLYSYFCPAAHHLVDFMKYGVCRLFTRKSKTWKRHSLDSCLSCNRCECLSQRHSSRLHVVCLKITTLKLIDCSHVPSVDTFVHFRHCDLYRHANYLCMRLLRMYFLLYSVTNLT